MNICTCIWYNEHVHEFHTKNIQTQFTLGEQIIIIDSIKAEPPWDTYPPDQLSLPSLCDFTFPTFSAWLYLPYTVCVVLPSVPSLCGSTFPTQSVWLYLPHSLCGSTFPTVCVALPSLLCLCGSTFRTVCVALPSLQSLCGSTFPTWPIPSLQFLCGSTFPTLPMWLYPPYGLCGSTFPTLQQTPQSSHISGQVWSRRVCLRGGSG